MNLTTLLTQTCVYNVLKRCEKGDKPFLLLVKKLYKCLKKPLLKQLLKNVYKHKINMF